MKTWNVQDKGILVKYHELGKTDIRVSAVAMGCWVFAGGSTWGAQHEADSIASVQAALDAGVSFEAGGEAWN